jgi:hypothetical protein
MYTLWKLAPALALFFACVGTHASNRDPNLAGLWRAAVGNDELVWLFREDGEWAGLIGDRLLGIDTPDDSVRYSVREEDGVQQLNLARRGTTGAMSFPYVLLNPDTMEVSLGAQVAAQQRGNAGALRLVFRRDRVAEEIVVDAKVATFRRTGRMWQVETSEREVSWDEAREYCRHLHVAGFNDWRLPTHKDLLSIVDLQNFRTARAARRSPLFSPLDQPGTGYMFSGTAVPGYPGAPFVMNMFNGHIFNGKDYIAFARCVREG